MAVAGLDPQCRYEIFGDTTAVAIIRFQLVCSGNDNTELFSNMIRAVLKETCCWRTTPQQALTGLGASPSGDTSILFLNWELAAAPLWQQCR